MPFVIDASVAASWFLPDEGHAVAAAARERLGDDKGIVPALWWFEMRNIFVVNERRGRLDSEKTEQFLSLLDRLPIRLDSRPDSDSVLWLARQHRLTAYDAAYLELARREGIPIATLDDSLGRAAQAEGIALIG
jgi:predicted nucleic acid-binding protein